MGLSAENGFVQDLPSVPVPKLLGPLKLWKVDTPDKHSFYTFAKDLEEAKFNLADYGADGAQVEPVDHSILVMPAGSLYMNSSEREEFFFSYRAFGDALDVALPANTEQEQNQKESMLTAHTEQMKALKEIYKRGTEQEMQK